MQLAAATRAESEGFTYRMRAMMSHFRDATKNNRFVPQRYALRSVMAVINLGSAMSKRTPMTSLKGDVFDPFRADFVERSDDCEIVSPPPRAAQVLVDLGRPRNANAEWSRRALNMFFCQVPDKSHTQRSIC